MRRLVKALGEQLRRTLQRPRRLLAVFDRQRLRKAVARFWQSARYGTEWRANREQSGLRSRAYDSYEAYREHQRSKLGQITADLDAHDRLFHDALSTRLASFDGGWHGRCVLCLAARQGTEVRAFLDAGAFAVGIDLNPGADNPYVVYGDFHQLQFPTASVDAVFTNSLDHALELGRLLAEVRRVLKPGGRFIVEAVDSDNDRGPGSFEACWWESLDDLARAIGQAGFELLSQTPFEVPWAGRQMLYARQAEATRLAEPATLDAAAR